MIARFIARIRGWLLASLKNFGLLVIGTLAGLALVEIGLRVFFPLDLQPIETLEAMPASEMICRHRPNSEWVSRSPVGEFTIPIRINSHGLRDREYSFAKPQGSFRIAMVGDSITEARQVTLENTFAKLLEQELNHINADRREYERLEVINFGVSGYGTDSELIRIKSDVLKYDPDLVVIVFVDNDLTNILNNGLFSLDKSGELLIRTFSRTWKQELLVRTLGRLHLFYYLRELLKGYPNLYKRLVSIFEGWTGSVESYDDQDARRVRNAETLERSYPSWLSFYVRKYQSAPQLEESYRLVARLFQEIDRLLRKSHIDLLVVHATNIIRIEPKWPWARALPWVSPFNLSAEDLDVSITYRRMSQIWGQLGIKSLDLSAFLDSCADGGQGLHFKEDAHLTPAGHRYFSKHILEYLTEHRLVFKRTS